MQRSQAIKIKMREKIFLFIPPKKFLVFVKKISDDLFSHSLDISRFAPLPDTKNLHAKIS